MRTRRIHNRTIVVSALIAACLLMAMTVAMAMATLLAPPRAFADDLDGSDNVSSQEVIASAAQHYQVFSDSGKSNQSNLVLFVKFSGDSSEVLNSAYIYSGEHNASGTPGQSGYISANHLHYSNYDYLWHDFNYVANADGTSEYGSNSSLQAYMKMASNSKYNVTSFFPQEAANKTIQNSDGESFSAKQIVYLQLDKTEAYYRNANSDEELVRDVFGKFQTAYASYDPSQLDADGDGSIDNISFVFQLQTAPSSQSDVFWPHMWSQSSLQNSYSIGSKQLYTYNFLYTYAAPSDAQSLSLGVSPGVTVHEYLHTLGLQDYYNNTLQSNNGSPVSPWDIMADKSYNYFLLSNTRKLLGWTSVPDISDSYTSKKTNTDKSTTYTCTLNKPFSSSGNQSFDVYTPMSGTEHFVFEYRQKTSLANNPLQPDSSLYINNSGLIIYRVNDGVASKSNYNDSDGFYVYVFRPGETGANAGGGNTFRATLETSDYNTGSYETDGAGLVLNYGARTKFGSTDLSATPASSATSDGGGTIYYSNGSNSGITVDVVSQTDDSITINVTVPDYSSLGLWDQVGGSAANGTASETSMEVSSDGSGIYQAYKDESAIKVRYWNGTAWTDLGTVATDSAAQAPQLKMVGSTLYCLYTRFVDSPSSSNPNTVTCKKWNGSSWTDAGTISTGSSYSQVMTTASIDGSLYALVDKDYKAAQLYRLSSSTFSSVGSSLPASYLLNPTLLSVNGETYVVCGDFENNGTKIYKLNGNEWSSIYSNGTSPVKTTAAVSAGSTLVAFSSDENNSKKIVAVNSAGNPSSYTFNKVSEGVVQATLEYSNGDVYLTLLTGSGVVSTWYASMADLSNWAQLGANVQTSVASMDTVTGGTKVYVGVTTADPLLAARVLSHALVTTTHKVTFKNWDGTVLTTETVADGAVATAPVADPARTGYTFIGWDKTFSNVTSDLTVTALFAINSYTITASAGAGGSIAPAGAAAVTFDGSKTYTIAANSGYAIADVKVDGVSQGARSTYTFANVSADHTIVATFAATAPPTSAKIVRLYGDGALDTMKAVVDAGSFAKGGTVVVATDGGYYDALTASALAGVSDGCVLLTNGGRLSSQTAAELKTLAPSKVVVVGGSGAVTDTVMGQIAAAAGLASSKVSRVYGYSATDTADAIWAEAKAEGLSSDTCIIATSDDFKDALSVAPAAYAQGYPIFLAGSGATLSAHTLSTIKAAGFTKAVVIGGTGALPTKKIDDVLKAKTHITSVSRKAGGSCFETSSAVAKWEISDLGMSANNLAVATADSYPDALCGAALCGKNNAILVLAVPSDTSCITGVVHANKASVTRAYLFGGTGVLPDKTIKAPLVKALA